MGPGKAHKQKSAPRDSPQMTVKRQEKSQWVSLSAPSDDDPGRRDTLTPLVAGNGPWWAVASLSAWAQGTSAARPLNNQVETSADAKHPRTPFERSRWAADASRAWI